MARPRKTGLDYFPLDVGFFEDDKILLISAEFGIKAEILIIRLLCKIYKNGYYYQWGEDECLLMVKSMGIVDCSKEWVQEVIQGLVRRCFFDKGCFDSFNVLTSSAIQSRYITAIAGRKLDTDNIPFWVLSSGSTHVIGVNPTKTLVNPQETPVNQAEMPQTKVNKTKVKETKEKNEYIHKHAQVENLNISKKENTDFEIFNSWIINKVPSVAKFKEPFTEAQFLRLKQKFSIVFIKEMLGVMHNKEASKTNRSANITFYAWVKNQKR